MNIPIGSPYTFSVTVLEENSFLPQDLSGVTKALFTIFDSNNRSTIAVLSGTRIVGTWNGAGSADGTIGFGSGYAVVVVTEIIVTGDRGLILSSNTSRALTNSASGSIGEVVDVTVAQSTPVANQTTTTTVTTTTTASRVGTIDFELTAVATAKFAETRRGRSDYRGLMTEYDGMILIDVPGRGTITVEVPGITAMKAI